jgi:hypothetical protein
MKKKAFARCKISVFTLSLFCCTIQAQKLHHQMLGSQGVNTSENNGIKVRQTIGQMSMAGSFTNSKIIVQQGFQQNTQFKSSNLLVPKSIITTVYPNPVVDHVNFAFSLPVEGIITVNIYDLMGRLISTRDKLAQNNILYVDFLENLSPGTFVIQLLAQDYKFSTKINKI